MMDEAFAVVIGGSGFYDLLEDAHTVEETTPFGKAVLQVGMHEDIPIAFLPRHGKSHSLPPHKINYRANFLAIHSLRPKWVVGTNAVGAVNPNLELGSVVLVHDFIDLWDEPLTFFEGDPSFSISANGKERKGVVHVDMTDPYCPKIRQYVEKVARSKSGFTIIPNGVYANTKGPRFETPAEIRALRVLGADVVGMTSAREAALARELALCYGSLCIVTNKAAGLQNSVTAHEVFKLFSTMVPKIKELILDVVRELWEQNESPCVFDH